MLIPIQTARAAAAPAEDASLKTQQPAIPLPASQRGEAIQKILDALTRHLSGREILSKDALVRLMEDLARILKFPPLPQEGGRDFVRRLVAFLETMPPSDRLLLERQLGGRSLALRVGLLADLPAIRNGAPAPNGTATPMPAQARDVILRNPSLQPAMPLNPSAARAAVAGEVALLQAVLRKTFSVGNDSDVFEAQGEDSERPSPSNLQQDRADRAPARAEARTGRHPSTDGAEAGSAAALLAGEGEIDDVAPLRAETAEIAQATEPHSEPVRNPPATDPTTSDTAPEAQQANEMEAGETVDSPIGDVVDDQDPDGTYGPLPDTDEDVDRTATRSPGRGEAETRPARVLSDAIKTLIRDSVALPAGAAAAETQPDDTGPLSAPPPTSAEEAALPGREADAAARRREAPDGGSPLPSLLDDQPEDTATAQRAPTDMRPQRPADEQTMQQVIARLVENGLPREAIPFTIIPYPAAADDAEHFKDAAHEMPGGSEDEASAEEQEAPAEDGGAEADENAGEMNDALAEDNVPEASDAYDLYRRLGGLG